MHTETAIPVKPLEPLGAIADARMVDLLSADAYDETNALLQEFGFLLTQDEDLPGSIQYSPERFITFGGAVRRNTGSQRILWHTDRHAKLLLHAKKGGEYLPADTGTSLIWRRDLFTTYQQGIQSLLGECPAVPEDFDTYLDRIRAYSNQNNFQLIQTKPRFDAVKQMRYLHAVLENPDKNDIGLLINIVQFLFIRPNSLFTREQHETFAVRYQEGLREHSYTHQWHAGDALLFDDSALFHARLKGTRSNGHFMRYCFNV